MFFQTRPTTASEEKNCQTPSYYARPLEICSARMVTHSLFSTLPVKGAREAYDSARPSCNVEAYS